MRAFAVVALLVVLGSPELTASQAPPQATSAINATSTPIRKVITLIQEMEVQVAKDGKLDEALAVIDSLVLSAFSQN